MLCCSTQDLWAARPITPMVSCRLLFSQRICDPRAARTGPLAAEELAHSQRRAIDTIQELNIEHRASREGFTDLDARIASYELAYRMQASALEVGDLDAETAATRAAYGLEHKDARTVSFARKCLLARRLVERGVRFVQLYDMPDKDGWDAHSAWYRTTNRERAGPINLRPRCWRI